MAIHSDSFYRRLAEDQVRDSGIFEPPVPLEPVASKLGVPVRTVTMPTFFSAAIINEDGLPTILLNAAVGEAERRRSFGHVLGHLLQVLADDDAGYPRTHDEHHEADLISTALIMPDGLVLDQARKWFNDYRYLAGLFGVTEDEMFDRMVELELVQQHGIRWDY